MKFRKVGIASQCRLNSKSKMPFVRRLGNIFYALLLSMFSSKKVRDTASGMRVIRRSSLSKLMPLPDGLHFTPAMSARAILSRDLKIEEIDMPYNEREGISKLNLWKDGLRFLRVIMETAFLYRPARILGLLGALSFFCAAGLMLMPALFFIQHHRLEEWMIYRFVVSDLAGITACLLICSGYLSAKIVGMTLSGPIWSERSRGWLGAIFSSRAFFLFPLGLMISGMFLIFPGLIHYIRTGTIYEHWSRFITMSFLFSAALILIVTKLVDYSLELITARVAYLKSLKGNDF